MKTTTKYRLILASIGLVATLLIAGTAWAIIGGNTGSNHQGQQSPSTNATTETSRGEGGKTAAEMREERNEVVEKALTVMNTWYPAKDNTQTAGVIRAKDRYFTKELAAITVEPARNAAGYEWLDMAKNSGHSVPTIEIIEPMDSHEASEEAAPSATGMEHVTAHVTWKWVFDGDKPTQKATDTRIYEIAVTKIEDGQWKIADYSYSVFPTKIVGAA